MSATPVKPVAVAAAPVGTSVKVDAKAPLAVVKPMEFTGKEEEVELFVLQLRCTFKLQEDKFPDNQKKVLYAMTLMKGRARD
jgi:hypothetical protein